MSGQACITGIGSFSPGDPIPFADIEKILGEITEASPKLMKRMKRVRRVIQGLLGIEYSHYAIDPVTREATESNVSMSTKSAVKALDMAGLKARDVDLLIYAGILYDCWCPPSSVLVQEELNIPYCAEMTIHSNCTAIYKAIQVAADLIRLGRYRNALVVTSQISSTFLRAEYFNQKALTEEQWILRWFLSDGAGALVLDGDPAGRPALVVEDTYLESVGVGIEPSMRMNVGATNWKPTEIYAGGHHHLVQDLKTVAKTAPELFRKGLNTMIAKTGLDVNTVKCFFANIPTMHMMDMAATGIRKDWGNPDLPFYTKLSSRGYQGAPAIVIALDDYLRETGMEEGDRLVSFVTESSKWMHAGFVLRYRKAAQSSLPRSVAGGGRREKVTAA